MKSLVFSTKSKISPPGAYQVMIWDQRRKRINNCQGHQLFVEKSSDHPEEKREFTLHVLRAFGTNLEQMAKCFAHFWGEITNEKGQFLLLKNGKILSQLFNKHYSITLVPLRTIGRIVIK